jgi:hypothetical protein
VNAEVDVDVGLQWLELGDAFDFDKVSLGSFQYGDSFESYSPRHFLCEVTMRKIIKSFSFHTRQLFFRQPQSSFYGLFKFSDDVKESCSTARASCVVDVSVLIRPPLLFVLCV